MKYLKQLAIIIAVSFAGEGLRFILPFPIPAGIYGLVIMFILLYSRVLKPESVETVSDFLVEIMAVMFVPGAVGIIAAWDRLQSMLLPSLCAIALVTPLVMAAVNILLKNKKILKNYCIFFFWCYNIIAS